MADDLLKHSVPFLRERGFADGTPHLALILGSGFGLVEHRAERHAQVRYADVPGMPPPSGTAGHECRLTRGTLWGASVLIFRGRYHGYEGHSARDLVATVRLAHALGARSLVVTNSAGGIRPDLGPGALMAIRDHINLMGVNPLVGPERMPGAPPFPAMGQAYDPALTGALVKAGKDAGEEISQGVYAAVLGPSFETPAEVEYLRNAGADAVGMSTVPEVIAARALNMRVCGLSLVTNRAGGDADSHEQTLKAGQDAEPRVARVLEELLRAIATDA
jgi:purine-nucleoside phosphorylase